MGSPGAWEKRYVHAGISGSLGGHPKDSGPLRYKSPLSEKDLPLESSSLIHLRVPPIRAPLEPRSNSHIAPMFPNEFFEFNINDFAGLDDSLDFNWLNWDSASPSQPYPGVDVQGDLGNYPNPLTPSTAPTSLYPTDRVLSSEGKLYCTSQ